VIWFFSDPLRSKWEREALEDLVSRVDWLVPGEWRIDGSLRLIWDAEIVVGDRSFPVSLRYPSHFPHSPPVVLPRGDTERWSSHQYGAGGELCLEFGPDNWRPDITGADMIESAHRLLAGERPSLQETGQVATRHATTLGQKLSGDLMRMLITRDLAAVIERITEGAMCEASLTSTWRDRSGVYTVSSITLPGDEKWSDTSIPKTIVSEGFDQAAAILLWPSDKKLPSLNSLADFHASALAQGFTIPDVKYVVLKKGDAFRAYFLWKDDDTVARISIISPQAQNIRMDESHASLKERKVAIVGCGSLGSKVAVMLARGGVENFLLIDDDIMLPDNIVRHDLDWREIGRLKVEGVATRIGLVNPSANCDTRQYRLGGQQSSGSVETLIERLATCDLIVDASANPKVFNYLCAAAEVGKKALLWAEVFGGGFGGLIARHRPERELAPAMMRAQIEQWSADQGKPIERAAGGYETQGDGPPMIADDADVSVIAAHAARLAIDTLIPREPSMFPSSVYMIGLSEGWIFDQPFDTRPIDVGLPEARVTEAVDETIAQEENARVLQLFKNYANASGTDTANSAAASE
jgi:molybdopterin/thiamine biosynthesis adenylyltransferase